MKGSIKHIILSILLFVAVFCKAQQEAVEEAYEEYTVEVENTEKKAFDKEAYEKIKNEVDLIENMEQKKLHEDSSQFGLGYGVEQGDSYTIYQYDSITGISRYSERQRGSGARNTGDGIQPDARNYQKRKAYQRRAAQERIENRRQQIKNRKLQKQEDLRKDKPRAEEIEDQKLKDKAKGKSSTSMSDDFFKFLLIIIIALILGAAGYMLFVNTPVEGGSAKILYDQEMNPDAVQLSELEIKINAAKDSKDFRSATRLYFVWVIKELSDKGHIQWKKRKTNYHYILEVEGQSFSEEFKVAVKNYEFIWYGKYDIELQDFTVVEKHFKGLIKEVTN